MKNYLIIFSVVVVAFVACGNKKETINNPVPVLEEKAQNEIIDKTEQQGEEKGSSPEKLAKAKELIEAASEERMAKFDAKKSFKNYCAICHGFKGNMMVNGAKDLTKSSIDLEESVAQVYFGKGLMTPFKGIMKDDEIVAVAKYIETLRR